jgi:hypothetical protein
MSRNRLCCSGSLVLRGRGGLRGMAVLICISVALGSQAVASTLGGIIVAFDNKGISLPLPLRTNVCVMGSPRAVGIINSHDDPSDALPCNKALVLIARERLASKRVIEVGYIGKQCFSGLISSAGHCWDRAARENASFERYPHFLRGSPAAVYNDYAGFDLPVGFHLFAGDGLGPNPRPLIIDDSSRAAARTPPQQRREYPQSTRNDEQAAGEPSGPPFWRIPVALAAGLGSSGVLAFGLLNLDNKRRFLGATLAGLGIGMMICGLTLMYVLPIPALGIGGSDAAASIGARNANRATLSIRECS